ncbi:hypothetical protein FIV07_27860 (plasmid) [Mycobacterium sp. THAF192]|nr:hypothetical protein FIV07_27860 [Mycobacterium sp. THAF192]
MNEPEFRPAADLETPAERAHRRATALSASVTDVLRTLADMYRDEDWRYLTDQHGNPYSGFTAFLKDHLGGSSSNARRYQQGITGLILPLQQLTAPNTLIPITSADIARLGQAGAQEVINNAAEALEGLTDPAAQTQALRVLIDRITEQKLPAIQPEPAAGSLVPSSLPSPALEAEHADDPLPPPNNGSTDEHTAARDEAPSQPANRPRPATADEPHPPQSSPELHRVIAEILRCDPVTSAQTATPEDRETLASDAIVAAHKLSRYGQLLQSLTPPSGGQAPSPTAGN